MAALSSEAVIDVIEEEHFDGPGDDEAAEAARKELARAASSPAPFPAVAKAGAAGDDGRVRARSGKKRTKFVQAGGSDLEGGKKRPHPPPPTEAPQVTSPWWSRATWHFATGLIYLAWRSPPLMEEDVWPLPREETAEELADKFLAEWAMEQERVKTLPPPKPQKDQTGPLPNHPPPSLLKALFRAFGRPLYTAAMLRYICEAGSLATPILLGRLVTYLAQCSFAYKLGQPDLCPAPWIGYMLAFGIFCISLIVSWCFGKHFQLSAEVGFRVRTALSVAVYRKSLRLSSAARLRWSGGAVVNLLSTDCARIDRTLKEIHTIHAAPIVIIVGFALMINTIGVSALASLAVIFVSIPLSGVIMSQAAKIRKRTNAITDERVKLTQEVISGIRVVKYLGWESAMTDRILKLRTAELKGIRAVLWTWVIVGVLSMAIPILSAFAMFLTYSSISTTPLTSAVVLQCISLVEVIRWPLLLLPLALQWATDSTVSLGRLQRMLSAEELEEKTSEQQEIADMADEKAPAVEIRNARFAWEEVAPEEDDPAKAAEKADAEKAAKKLKREEEKAKRKVKEMEEEEAKQRDGSNWVWRTKTKRGQKQAEPAAVELAAKAAVEAVDAPTDEPKPAESDGTFNLDIDRLEIKRNAFVCVVGAVGSGKSSLISALIKDMKLVGPADSSAAYSVALRGRVAYCPQLAWIQNASIKDNITFGRPLDQARFDDVIRVCAMEKDLDMLPDGPETMVGEKGLTLSGGQKQRTSLARAVYADADVYLLDDPLSAVDAHVSNHIVQQTLLGALANKTRVLTTHQLHVLPHCDYVVVMRQGAIVEQGTFKGLLAQEDGYLAALVRDYGAGLAEEEEETALEVSAGDQPLADDNNTQRRASQTVIDQRRASQARIKIGRGPSTTSIPAGAKPDLGATVTPDKKQPRELMSQEERTEGAVALSVYADYIRFGGGVLKFAGPVALMLILMQSAKILTDWWVSSAWAANRFPLALSGYQGIYAALAIIQLVFVALGGIILAAGATKAAANIHSQALSNVLRAPVNTFFDVTPVGRIMNRLSKDTDIVDSWIPDITNWFLRFASNVIAVLVLVAVATPIFLAPFVFILVFYVLVSTWYRYVARDLKRLEAIARSPVYALFSETLSGLSTIRAYASESRFISRAQGLINVDNKFWMAQIFTVRWMGLRLEYLAALVVFLAAVFAVTAAQTTAIDPGLLGLSITYALQIIGILNGAQELAAELEAHHNSTERLLHFAEEIEPQDYEKGKQPPPEWPQLGAIKFNNVQMRYANDLPLVLKGLTLDIKPGMRVGIVGRTGAGKSSIMQTLFRLIDPCGGSIEVDGLNLADVKLDAIRSRMTMIPQDPVLFSGTFRSNLDPFGLYTDEEIWSVLDFAANLKQTVLSNPAKLDMLVAEDGANFSLGERALICLARAMLRRSRVVVLDEATASVDLESDNLIQQVLRTNPRFAGTTILTIAHRLLTVIDYDLIVFLADGKALEVGSPAELVSRDGPFRKLINETGKENAEVLVKLALARKYEAEEEFEKEVNMVRRASMAPPPRKESVDEDLE